MILGVTGGIATGKSTVAHAFEELGAPVVSADEIARDVVRPGPVLDRLVKHFGSQILDTDGTLNRQALGEIIFPTPEARSVLNSIVHPAIAAEVERRLAELTGLRRPLIVYESPLLFEAGAEKRVDAVLVVVVAPDIQLERLMARDGRGEADARSRIAAQFPLAEKVARADYLIDNSGSIEETLTQVNSLFHHLLHLCRQSPQSLPEIPG